MISPSLSHDDNDSRWFLLLTVIVVFVRFLVYASAVLLCIFHIVVRLHTFWKEVCQYSFCLFWILVYRVFQVSYKFISHTQIVAACRKVSQSACPFRILFKVIGNIYAYWSMLCSYRDTAIWNVYSVGLFVNL